MRPLLLHASSPARAPTIAASFILNSPTARCLHRSLGPCRDVLQRIGNESRRHSAHRGRRVSNATGARIHQNGVASSDRRNARVRRRQQHRNARGEASLHLLARETRRPICAFARRARSEGHADAIAEHPSLRC